MSAPIESPAENRFDDEVVGGTRGADADAEIDFPHWRDVEVGDEKELLLLVMGRGEVTQGPIICVVLEAGADYSREIIADLGAWCEAQALVDVRAMQSAFERGVDGEVPAADRLVDDGSDFPGPGVGRIGGALKTDLGGQTDAYRPPPGFRDADAGPDVIAYPLHAVAVLLA